MPFDGFHRPAVPVIAKSMPKPKPSPNKPKEQPKPKAKPKAPPAPISQPEPSSDDPVQFQSPTLQPEIGQLISQIPDSTHKEPVGGVVAPAALLLTPLGAVLKAAQHLSAES